MNMTEVEIRAAYRCACEAITARQRTGAPVPQWMRQLHRHLENAIMWPDETEPESEEINSRECAEIIGCTMRTARNLAPSLDAKKVGRDWIYRRAIVTEYASACGTSATPCRPTIER